MKTQDKFENLKRSCTRIFCVIVLFIFCSACVVVQLEETNYSGPVATTVSEITLESTIVPTTEIPKVIETVEVETTVEATEPAEMMDMHYQTSAKTYMDYRAITNKSSNQYKLIHSEQITICEDGLLRDVDGHIGVAMGSYFGPIGSRYICYLDNGKSIPVIKVEAKSDAHTVNGFCGSTSYDIIEFVIDTRADYMRDNIYSNGYVFCGNFNNCEDFEGTIMEIEKV